MVAALVLAGALHGQQIVRLLDDAEQRRVARGVGADAAGVLVGDVEAGRAGDDALLEGDERLGQLAHLVGRPLEEKERHPLGRLGPHAGQPLERLDESRDGLGVVGHGPPTFRARGSSGRR